MSLLCTLKNISLSFGPKIIFDHAELSINHGDHIGLLGLNGKGKSSLFKILAEKNRPDISTPPFQFDKSKDYSCFYIPQEIAPHDLNQNAEEVFLTFYPEFKSLFDELKKSKNADHQAKLHEQITDSGFYQIEQNYKSYLKTFHFEHVHAPLKQLSGGEQKKVLLALGLSSPAKLILWDEPTNHLDIETIKLFEGELELTPQAFILITHDRYLLSKLCKRIFQIKNGIIESFTGSYTDYLDYLQLQETHRQSLLNKLRNSLSRETAWMRQGIKARGTRSKKRVENFLDLKQQVSVVKGEAKRSIEMSMSHSKRQTKVLIELKNVEFGHSQKTLFENVSLILQKGDKVGLIGKNGVGKSTLIEIIKAQLAPRQGQLKQAENIKINHFSQTRAELPSEMTPYQLLGDGSDFITLPDGNKRHVISYFENFLFHRDDIHRPIKTFSGGEKSRLQLAHNLTKSGDLLIFDEPTNDLDLETIFILEEKLRTFDGAFLLVSHDRAFLSQVTNKIWYIHQQQIENFEGGYEQVEAYIDASILEEELEAESSELEPVQTTTKKVSEKISHKEKMRLEEIYEIISGKEEKLKLLNQKLEVIDFTNLSTAQNIQYRALMEAQKILEKEIEDLFEELSDLEAKNF